MLLLLVEPKVTSMSATLDASSLLDDRNMVQVVFGSDVMLKGVHTLCSLRVNRYRPAPGLDLD